MIINNFNSLKLDGKSKFEIKNNNDLSTLNNFIIAKDFILSDLWRTRWCRSFHANSILF